MNSDYVKAGDICSQVINKAHKIVHPGKRVIDIVREVREEVRNLGADLAFPTSLAINEVAAHYSPLLDDDTIIPNNSLIKFDMGVHVNGYISDCARTIAIGDYPKSVYESAIAALRLARDILKPGITLAEFGNAIEQEIRNYGVKPIYNLTGHLMDRYIIHAGLSVPNSSNSSTTQLKPGMAVAIEPFTTNGEGYITERGRPGIYSLPKYINVRNASTRKIISHVYSARKTLPFAEYWIEEKFGKFATKTGLNFAIKSGVLIDYPPLVEISGGMVGQFEASFYINENGVEIIGGPKEIE